MVPLVVQNPRFDLRTGGFVMSRTGSHPSWLSRRTAGGTAGCELGEQQAAPLVVQSLGSISGPGVLSCPGPDFAHLHPLGAARLAVSAMAEQLPTNRHINTASLNRHLSHTGPFSPTSVHDPPSVPRFLPLIRFPPTPTAIPSPLCAPDGGIRVSFAFGGSGHWVASVRDPRCAASGQRAGGGPVSHAGRVCAHPVRFPREVGSVGVGPASRPCLPETRGERRRRALSHSVPAPVRPGGTR